MISVLIPVYNTDVRALVKELFVQLSSSGIKYEILLLDDGSDKIYIDCNAVCQFNENISLTENGSNRGRIYTRNKLAAQAKYTWLLFLDADCQIASSDFIANYLGSLDKTSEVIYGGTNYLTTIPDDCRYRLHWQYARERVGITDAGHVKRKGFLFNNILIRKFFYHQLQFPESLNGYGHEDTWVGIQLDHLQANIQAIINPVLHTELDTNETFFQKHQSALHNLKVLASISSEKALARHVRIFRYYLHLQKAGLQSSFYRTISLFEKGIKANLFGCQPNLLLFDLLRLKMFISIMRNDK